MKLNTLFKLTLILIIQKNMLFSVSEGSPVNLQIDLMDRYWQEVEDFKKDTRGKYTCERGSFGIRCSEDGQKLPYKPEKGPIELPIGWIVIEESLNNEKVLVAFPAYPKITSEKEGVKHEVSDLKGVYYYLNVIARSKPPEIEGEKKQDSLEHITDPIERILTFALQEQQKSGKEKEPEEKNIYKEEDLFARFLDTYSQKDMNLKQFEITTWKGFPVLDIQAEQNQGLLVKARILITDKNIYWFSTIYDSSNQEHHDQFIHSFRFQP